MSAVVHSPPSRLPMSRPVSACEGLPWLLFNDGVRVQPGLGHTSPPITGPEHLERRGPVSGLVRTFRRSRTLKLQKSLFIRSAYIIGAFVFFVRGSKCISGDLKILSILSCGSGGYNLFSRVMIIPRVGRDEFSLANFAITLASRLKIGHISRRSQSIGGRVGRRKGSLMSL